MASTELTPDPQQIEVSRDAMQFVRFIEAKHFIKIDDDVRQDLVDTIAHLITAVTTHNKDLHRKRARQARQGKEQ